MTGDLRRAHTGGSRCLRHPRPSGGVPRVLQLLCVARPLQHLHWATKGLGAWPAAAAATAGEVQPCWLRAAATALRGGGLALALLWIAVPHAAACDARSCMLAADTKLLVRTVPRHKAAHVLPAVNAEGGPLVEDDGLGAIRRMWLLSLHRRRMAGNVAGMYTLSRHTQTGTRAAAPDHWLYILASQRIHIHVYVGMLGSAKPTAAAVMWFGAGHQLLLCLCDCLLTQ